MFMANKHNFAYDLRKYEDAVHKDEKAAEQENQPKKIKVTKPRAESQGSAPKILVSAVAMGLLLGMVIYGKVEEASLHAEIAAETKNVDMLRSENVRMKSEIEGKSSIKAVEDYAENVLGMKKLDKSQIEYISIENGNVIDIPEANKNVFVWIKNGFNDFLEYIRG